MSMCICHTNTKHTRGLNLVGKSHKFKYKRPLFHCKMGGPLYIHNIILQILSSLSKLYFDNSHFCAPTIPFSPFCFHHLLSSQLSSLRSLFVIQWFANHFTECLLNFHKKVLWSVIYET